MLIAWIRKDWTCWALQHIKAAKLIAGVNRQQRSCPFLFWLQGASVSQAWVEGEIIHPDCQLKLATALSCVVRQCVLLLEDLRVKILKQKWRTSQLYVYGQPTATYWNHVYLDSIHALIDSHPRTLAEVFYSWFLKKYKQHSWAVLKMGILWLQSLEPFIRVHTMASSQWISKSTRFSTIHWICIVLSRKVNILRLLEHS